MGHIFQLGRKYADALDLQVLDENGKLVTVTMGSYGDRRLARRGRHRREHPRRARPVLAARGRAGRRARRRHRQGRGDLRGSRADRRTSSTTRGIDRALRRPRRKVSPGVKFKDAELLGVPTIVVVGKGLAEGTVEVKDRATGEREDVAVDAGRGPRGPRSSADPAVELPARPATASGASASAVAVHACRPRCRPRLRPGRVRQASDVAPTWPLEHAACDAPRVELSPRASRVGRGRCSVGRASGASCARARHRGSRACRPPRPRRWRDGRVRCFSGTREAFQCVPAVPGSCLQLRGWAGSDVGPRASSRVRVPPCPSTRICDWGGSLTPWQLDCRGGRPVVRRSVRPDVRRERAGQPDRVELVARPPAERA